MKVLSLIDQAELDLVVVVVVVVSHRYHRDPSIVEVEVSCADLGKHFEEQVLINCLLFEHLRMLQHAYPKQLPLLLAVLSLLLDCAYEGLVMNCSDV